ncbi:MAG: GNAT family N-acetyltransferase [Saprospiraceae bacterium]|nr:GNAT family N-acetyltransferase [Saprospiraceae bacterium]
MSEQLTIRPIDFMGEDFDEVMALRTEVLRKPLNMVFLEKDIAEEFDSHHIAAFFREQIVACLILKPVGQGIMKMRQVAVHADYQGKGMGKKLVAYSEMFALQHGVHKIELHARMTAVPFYLSMAYTVVGEEFLEVGLPHLKMEKRLD